jgi:hypothetical protein
VTFGRWCRGLVLLGLGSVAGAVLPTALRAQVPVRRDTTTGPRRDTLATRVDTARARAARPPGGPDSIRVPLPARADSILRNDSTQASVVPLPVKPPADTIKRPLARAEAPPILEIGVPRIYDRAAMYATGAQTLSDLLGRVPGLTEFTTGWLGAPSVVASQGDLRRIRIFLDGLELDPMDQRAHGVAAPNDLPLNILEELRIERAAEEVRVYARSWRVDRTIPFTRADIATGDQNTNLYRAFFGRRFARGEALQVAAEQFNTQPARALPSSDALNLMLRFGLTRGPWSADLFGARTNRNRAPWVGTGGSLDTRDTVPGVATRRTTAYARVGNGDPDRGAWGQLIASSHAYRISPRASNSFLSGANPSAGDSGTVAADTALVVGQYLLTGGITRGPLRLSAAQRLRAAGGRRSFSRSARAAFGVDRLGVSLFGESSSPLSPARYEATVRLAPISRIVLLGSAVRTGYSGIERVLGDTLFGRVFDTTGVLLPARTDGLAGYDSTQVSQYVLQPQSSYRAEAGVRLRDLWLGVGLLRRDATTLLPPAELDSISARGASVRREGVATGRLVTARGRIYRSLYADVWALAWDDSTGLYRPRYQTRSELYIQTNLLNRFPKGNFGLLTSLAHEYRSGARFPAGADSTITTIGSRNVAFKLEIRIQTAVVSYQFRNLLQERYEQVPGFNMPRQTQFYGVRWEFWN